MSSVSPKASDGSEERLGLLELIAIGVGGMVGGGIFSVLGLAVGIAGHATPIAFGIGSLVALAAAYSYVRLALTYRDDGASFTFMERAFPDHPNVAAIAGWTVVAGYIGTLALYAFTFGAYGSNLLGDADSTALRTALSLSVLGFFLLVNLRGVRSSGLTEDLIVYAKIGLLGVFAIIGAGQVELSRIEPLVDEGVPAIVMAGALVFVAFEGFQLITNVVLETEAPDRNVPRGVYGSIAITSVIYIAIALVAVGTLSAAEIERAGEYSLALVAEPVLGQAGVVMIGLAALLSTSSAINATVFGASRMMWQMATRHSMPRSFLFRNRRDVPWAAVAALTGLATLLTIFGGLEVIAAFSSLTFLIVSVGVSVANLRMHADTRSRRSIVLLGILLMVSTVAALITYLVLNDVMTLAWIVALYVGVFAAELIFRRQSTR